jgi:hypothetical protein
LCCYKSALSRRRCLSCEVAKLLWRTRRGGGGGGGGGSRAARLKYFLERAAKKSSRANFAEFERARGFKERMAAVNRFMRARWV